MREIIARFDDEDKKPFVYGEEVGEIIRCKDCKYREYGYCNLYLSFYRITADMDYCSRAERKYAVTMTKGRAKPKNIAEGKKAYTADTSVLKVRKEDD